MVRSTCLASLALLLAASAPARGQEAGEGERRGQELIAGEGIRDHDYLFELRRPAGTAWRLLGEEEARQISPEATAAMIRSPEPVFGAVIVEPTPAADDALVAMARLVVEGMPLSEKVVEREEALTFVGLPARRVVLSGVLNGVRLRYCNTIVSHRGYTYQLLAGGSQSYVPLDCSSLRPVWQAFRFLPGERVRPRELVSVQAAQGVGWRVVDGRFESAASGLVISPPQGWRVAIDADLDQMSTNAEVGLICNAPTLFATFIDEPVGADGGAALEAYVREAFTRNKGAPPEGEVQLELAGAPVRFTRRRLAAAGASFEFVHGVLLREGRVIQVEAWWSEGVEGALEALGDALAQVRQLDAAERARLADELLAAGDPETIVTADLSLRRGVLRDFAFDVVWRKPSALWSVEPVDPDEHGENARAQLSDASSGLYGLLAAERAAGLEPLDFHETIIGMVAPTGTRQGEPERRQVGAQELWVSFVDQEGEVPITYVVVTALAGDRAIRALLWGLREHVAARRDAVLAAADALEVLPRDLAPSTVTGDVVRDERLGFRFDPPGEGWRVRDATPPQIGGLGTITVFEKDGRELGVIAMQPLQQGQGDEWLDRMLSHALRNLSLQGGGTRTDPTPVTFAGLAGTRHGVRDAKGRVTMEFVRARRDGIVFMMFASAPAGDVGMDEALEALELLD